MSDFGHKNGMVAEQAFVLRLLELGYTRIFRPVTDYGVDLRRTTSWSG